MSYKAAVVTVSDTRTMEDDLSGKKACDILADAGFEVVSYSIVRDEKEDIRSCLCDLSDTAGVDIVLTSGGTGFGPRDVTPEATMSAIDRTVPGFAELMRAEGSKQTKKAYLSRAVSGIRGKTLIINLPGSPGGVKESLAAVVDLFEHALLMVKGGSHA